MLNWKNVVERVALFGGIGSTLIVNPWFQLDPINIPKMVLLVTVAAFIAPWVFASLKGMIGIARFVSVLALLFGLTLVGSVLQSEAPRVQQIWGTWGRSTGLATYIAFVVVLLAFLLLSSNSYMEKSRLVFERVGYVVTTYATLQWADLDPIDWSQKALVSTLGNINFMSSLLGMASISYVSRIFFEKVPIYTRIFFIMIITLNLLLIITSGSIQGIAILLAGIVLICSFFIRSRRSLASSIAFLSFSSFVGLAGLLGTASIGPLGFLRQETVIYRLDYWKAGIRMTLDNPWAGIGLDSYGDFYRFYRDEAAILRTGPQRVTNTAHNIFLDVSSGAGLPSLVFFGLLFVVTAYLIFRALMSNSYDSNFVFWSAQFLGFIVFCLISINQIGVGIWGFISMGLIIGRSQEGFQTFGKTIGQMPRRSNSTEAREIPSPKGGARKVPGFVVNSGSSHAAVKVAQCVVAASVFALAFSQARLDWLILKSFRSGNLDSAYRIALSPWAQDQHREITFLRLDENGQSEDALNLARRSLSLNKRNWQARVFVLSSDLSSKEDKIEAAQTLLELDPQNRQVRQELAPLIP